MEGGGFACVSPHVYRTLVTEVCLSLDTPHERRFGGGILCVTFGEFTGLHRSVLNVFLGSGSDSIVVTLKMLALDGPPVSMDIMHVWLLG